MTAPVNPLHRLAPLLPLVAALSCAAQPPPSHPVRTSAITLRPAAPASVASASRPERPARAAGPCKPGSNVDLAAITTPVQGSFSAPGVEEIAGEIQCDEERTRGDALVHRVGAHFQLVRIAMRVDFRTHRSECRALRTPSGRDLLLCREDATTYGRHDQAVVAIDYARDEEDGRIDLVSVSDTTDTSCNGGPDVVAAELEGYALVDLDGDGVQDVRVTVRAAEARVPPRPDCVMGSVGSGDPPRVPRPPPQFIDLLTKGNVLVPTPATVRVLATLAILGR